MDEAQPVEATAPLRVDGHLDAGALGTIWWITDVGKVRSRNEDRLFVRSAWGGRYLVLVVADGAGGHDSGDKAAEAVIATLDQWFPEGGDVPEGEPGAWLAEVVAAAHQRVRDLGTGQPRPPASTIVGLLIETDSLCGWRFHVGDSRLYVRGRSRSLEAWTRDHNIINGLIDRGLPEAQAQRIAEGGRLTQVIGGMTTPEPDIWGPIQLEPGLCVLLCSDGVYGHNRGRDVLGPAMDDSRGDLERRIQELKVAVLDGEAPDNLTAVVWDIAPTATPTRQRDTVEQQTRGPDAAALRDREVHESAREESTDDDEPARNPVRWVVPFLILGAVLWWMSRATLPPDAPPAATTAAAPTPAPPPAAELPWAMDLGVRQIQEGVVRKLGPAFTTAPEAERHAVVELLGTLLGARSLGGVELRWEEGAARAQSGIAYEDWPLPGPENRERAAAAWAARGELAARHSDLAAQPGLADWMRYAACAQVKARWPQGGELDSGQLASWIAACLPPGTTTPVTVKLGDWPSRGWTKADLAEIDTLSKPGGHMALNGSAPATPRMQELGTLARALADSSLSDVRATVRVVLPPADPPGNLPPDRLRKRAQGLAEGIAALVKEASGGVARVVPLGEVDDDPIAPVGDESTLTVDQVIHIADLNRRVEVTLNREPPLDEDDGAAPTP